MCSRSPRWIASLADQNMAFSPHLFLLFYECVNICSKPGSLFCRLWKDRHTVPSERHLQYVCTSALFICAPPALYALFSLALKICFDDKHFSQEWPIRLCIHTTDLEKFTLQQLQDGARAPLVARALTNQPHAWRIPNLEFLCKFYQLVATNFLMGPFLHRRFSSN